MGLKLEAVAFGEGCHLRHWCHVRSRAAQHHDVGVVDHHGLTGAIEVLQRVGEEHLAVKSLEGRVKLEKQHARIAQHRGGGLHRAQLAGHLDLVGRSIVLAFFCRIEVVLS